MVITRSFIGLNHYSNLRKNFEGLTVSQTSDQSLKLVGRRKNLTKIFFIKISDYKLGFIVLQ